MIPIWGMMVARAPTAKAFKSLYIASNQSAIMQDLSYLRCLMLIGDSRADILSGISKLVTEDYNVSGISNGELSSGREIVGVATSTDTGNYLGSIRYQLVTPKSQDEKFKLIIWYHPVMENELILELSSAYDLEQQDENCTNVEGMEHDLNHDEKKFLWKLVSCREWANDQTGVVMKDMSEYYNRIRLTGPKSLAILKQIFQIGSHPSSRPEHRLCQEQFWNNLESITSMPDNMMIVLDVVDPRLQRPQVRKAVKVADKGKTDSRDLLSPPTSSMGSDSLWSEGTVRQQLREKMPDKQVSEKRSQNLIPGTCHFIILVIHMSVWNRLVVFYLLLHFYRNKHC